MYLLFYANLKANVKFGNTVAFFLRGKKEIKSNFKLECKVIFHSLPKLFQLHLEYETSSLTKSYYKLTKIKNAFFTYGSSALF